MNFQLSKNIGHLFMVFLALIPVIALFSPRFLAYYPALGGLIFFLLHTVKYKKIPALPKSIICAMLAFLTLVALSAFWALDPEFAIERTLKLAAILLPSYLLISVAATLSREEVEPYAIYPIITLSLTALIAALELVLDFPLARLLSSIPEQEVVEPASLNRFAVVLFCFLFLMSYFVKLLQLTARKKKIALSVLFLCFGAFFCLTDSQSAQLGLLLGGLFFFLFPYNKSYMWYSLAFILISGLITAPFLSIFLFQNIADDIAFLPFLGEGHGFAGQRLEIWDMVSRYALQSPLYGHGIEATRAVSEFDSQQLYRQSVTELHPHNFAVQIWIEFGLLGAVLTSLLFARIIYVLNKLAYSTARPALCGLICLLPAMAFGYGLWQGWLVGLFMLVLTSVYFMQNLDGQKNDIVQV